MNRLLNSLGAMACLVLASTAYAQGGSGLPPTLYEEWRKCPSPADGRVVRANPPSLQWASVKHWENRDVLYRIDLSDDPSFPADRTHRGKVQRWCFYNPHARLAPGQWYWRYEILDGRNRTVKGRYSFVVPREAPVFESPTFDKLLASIPRAHPRVITQGRELDDIRSSAATHPLAAEVLERGRQALEAPPYRGPLSDEDPARRRALEKRAAKEARRLQELLHAYLLSGDVAMRRALIDRVRLLVQWPTDDLLGSQVLTALSKAYDALHGELSPGDQARLLAVIDARLQKGLARWPGNIEGRHVENHFWQMELSANFTAALATVHDSEAGREMLQYAYELFLARFPNLATADGGWAEGLGYFGVNKSAVVDMALLMKKVGRVDVFKMPWYRSLADYYIYFAPIDGRIDGFGDMHDRVGEGDIGAAEMLVVGEENRDQKALFRAASLMKSGLAVEPWYQIVQGIAFDPASVSPPDTLPQARMFRGVGLAALHTNVLDSSRDTAVYFRSSPFGAKGHMHANQNAFNLSRRGEPLFYSTGYYTSFADPHSMSSYRHTRAHNTILVNGCGQAFGHEGYGWIKRYANGEKISYVCGDATMAYRPTVDEQFLDLLAESKIAPTRENGYGDGRLKLFERHLVFIRPDTVVVYDVLESEEESDWTLLLHTMKKPTLNKSGLLRLETGKNVASGFVVGAQPLRFRMTDRFHTPPVDFMKKYKGTPNQFHITCASTEKSTTTRFLTILQMADPGEEAPRVIRTRGNEFTLGDITLCAELDPTRPASLSAQLDSARLYVNAIPSKVFGQRIPRPVAPATLLAEEREGGVSVTISENMPPCGPRWVGASAQEAARSKKPVDLLKGAKRIIFLGDSITYQGHYVAMFDAWLETQKFADPPIVINVGLSSETVSGLSEEGHAGGRFPRPDLAERLDRVLKVTRPDVVFACYGINCGIYQPFDEDRFRAYRKGMEHLREKVEAAGATLIQITPPCYDDLRRPKGFSYNAVLDRYADYLLAGRAHGRLVVALHHAMTAELARRRESDPDFAFQKDAVHPDFAGHWFMAGRLIRWFGDHEAASAESPQAMLEARGLPAEVYDLLAERMAVRRNAYLSAAGHTRPGVREGLPIEEAEKEARRLTVMIQDLEAAARR